MAPHTKKKKTWWTALTCSKSVINVERSRDQKGLKLGVYFHYNLTPKYINQVHHENNDNVKQKLNIID